MAFWIADESAQTLERRAVSDEYLGTDFSLKQMPFGQGGVGWVAAQRRSSTSPTFMSMRGSRSRTGGATMHSAVCLPSLSSSKRPWLAC